MNEDAKLAFASLLNPFAYYLNMSSEKRERARNLAFGKLRTVEEKKKLSMRYNRI